MIAGTGASRIGGRNSVCPRSAPPHGGQRQRPAGRCPPRLDSSRPAEAVPARIYPVLQETDGHVHWPLGEIVTPQLLPLPLGVATITYWLGQVALTFQVE